MIRAALILAFFTSTANAAEIPGFRKGAWFDEQVREEWVAEGVRALANAAGNFDPKKPTRLVLYATPNGNTIEQTLGCASADGIDWHFDIQHVAAQIRQLRTIRPDENVVLVCTEAEGLSWPAWKRKFADGPARVRKVVETLRGWIPAGMLRLELAAHSGGGSFLFGYLDAHDAVPAEVERIIFLDANYSYGDTDKHGDKLLAWLKGERARRLAVIAYDDRDVKLNGKPIVGAEGGTFRATERMRARFSKDVELSESTAGDFATRTGMNGQIALHVHTNPMKRILHTALVGEMNGLLHALTDNLPKAPLAYADRVQPAPGIPARPKDAVGGKAFFATLEKLSRNEREEAIAREIVRGNLPEFLRTFHKLTLKAQDANGKEHSATVEVMPDYLAVGGDADFVRVPVTPMTAARIADAFGCALPTRKIVDDVYRAATVKLEPRPLTKDRESPATFLEHHAIIERQRGDRKPGELVAGIKKDVVISNRVAERPNRVAIYGWHKLDGSPIQTLTTVHINWYVDYSHGARLMKRSVNIDGKVRDMRHALYAADLAPLLSDEGPIVRPAY